MEPETKKVEHSVKTQRHKGHCRMIDIETGAMQPQAKNAQDCGDHQPPELRHKKFLLFYAKLKRHLHPYVHGSTTDNSQGMEATQVLIGR